MSIEITSTTDSNTDVQSASGDKTTEPVKEETKAESTDDVQKDENKTEESETSEESEEEEEEEEKEEKEENGEKEEDGEKDEVKGKKKTSGFKKRIQRFQRRLSDKDQEIEHWKKEALKQKESSPENRTDETLKADETEKPMADNFETHEEFIEALTDWKIEARDLKNQAKNKENQAKTAYQGQVKDFQSKAQEFAKNHDDFEDVLADVSDIQISPGLEESMLSSELGPDVMYELANNREELERINKLSPLAAAREVGKIEARLSKGQSPDSTKRKKSKAPNPVNPVKGKSDKSSLQSIYDTDISQADYERLRAKELSNP